MAKKKKQEESTIENYYDLKTKEVDELVAALKGETPADAEPITTNIAEITGEAPKAKRGKSKAEFDPYKVDKLSRVPVWLKAIFIKWWFAGMVCYFINMGLGNYITDSLDLLALDGIVLGILVDIMVNPIFHYIESSEKEYDYYMMFPFPFKKYWTFPANIVYYLIVFLGVNGIYYLINGVWELNIYLEPLLFGVFCLVVDMALIGIKDLIVYLIRRGKKKKENISDV